MMGFGKFIDPVISGYFFRYFYSLIFLGSVFLCETNMTSFTVKITSFNSRDTSFTTWLCFQAVMVVFSGVYIFVLETKQRQHQPMMELGPRSSQEQRMKI